MKTKRILLVLAVAALLPASLMAGNERKTIFRKSLPVGSANIVKTDISFFAGELYMNARSEKLTECYYGYKNLYIEPFMQYREMDRIGYLSVKCKRKNREQLDNSSNANRWKLQVNPKVTYDMTVEVMAGEADINLQGAKLSDFNFKMTAGESHINLRNTSVPRIQCDMVAGESHLDLSGVWKNDCDAEIKGGVGQINVKVPFRTGVKIRISGLLGEVDIPFFNRDGRTYTNDAWGKTKQSITLDISGAIGQINVEMVE